MQDFPHTLGALTYLHASSYQVEPTSQHTFEHLYSSHQPAFNGDQNDTITTLEYMTKIFARSQPLEVPAYVLSECIPGFNGGVSLWSALSRLCSFNPAC